MRDLAAMHDCGLATIKKAVDAHSVEPNDKGFRKPGFVSPRKGKSKYADW